MSCDAMLLVDATIELADGLIAEGVKPKGTDDLIAAAAQIATSCRTPLTCMSLPSPCAMTAPRSITT